MKFGEGLINFMHHWGPCASGIDRREKIIPRTGFRSEPAAALWGSLQKTFYECLLYRIGQTSGHVGNVVLLVRLVILARLNTGVDVIPKSLKPNGLKQCGNSGGGGVHVNFSKPTNLSQRRKPVKFLPDP